MTVAGAWVQEALGAAGFDGPEPPTPRRPPLWGRGQGHLIRAREEAASCSSCAPPRESSGDPGPGPEEIRPQTHRGDSPHPLSAVTDPPALTPPPPPPTPHPRQGKPSGEVEPRGVASEQAGTEREEGKVYVLGGGGLAGWFPAAEALPANSDRGV